MSERPLVTVVIPVKDGERFLPQALADVAAQTYDHREIVVVDGRSSDRSAEIAAAFPGSRCIEQVRDGFGDALDVGIRAARGELIAFLDSDDRWMPEKLTLQVDLLERKPEVDYVVTRLRFFLEPGRPMPPGFRPELLEGDHVGNMPSTLLTRASVFNRIGGFSGDYRIANDIDWFARAADSGLRRAVLPEVMVRKRVHDTNLSFSDAGELNSELLDVLRRSIARRRA